MAPVGQTLLEGQKGERSHFSSMTKAFLPFFNFFSVFKYVPPSGFEIIIYLMGV